MLEYADFVLLLAVLVAALVAAWVVHLGGQDHGGLL